MMIGKLNCGVQVRFEVKGNRKVALSTVFIRMGSGVIADRTIPGKWTEEQGLKEFKRFPARFKPRTGWTAETLAAVAA